MSLWSRFVNVFRNERMIDDIDEELSAHIADAIEHGRDPEELRRAFGPLLRHREASRDLRRIAWFGDLLMDLRYGARVLRCQPAFFAAAVLSLGVGIGANAAIFSVTDALLLRSLPVSHPEQLVLLRDSVTDNFSYPEFVLLRDGSRTLSGLIAASPARPVPVAIGGYAGQASTKMVSGNYFAELGIAAEMGRVFSAADETMPVAVISDDYWHRQFGGSARVLGGTVAIAGMPVSIVGIAPPRFAGETPGESPDIWTSLGLRPAEVRADRGFTWLYLLGRRKPGRTVSQIHDDLAALLVQARPTAPSAETKARLIVGPGARGIQMLGEHLADPLRVAMMLASLVLLIVCTNLASLLLARGTARRWEIAMRIAIGASRARALRQLLTESALLAAAGGALAMVVGVWGGAALLRVPVGSRPIVLHTGLNLRVVVFTAGVSTIAALLFGLAPAWRATRAAALRGSTHIVAHEHAGGVRHALIAVQV
ncbi:MAG: ABC transporter permease, partial [Vicinamibacterales bacterium]